MELSSYGMEINENGIPFLVSERKYSYEGSLSAPASVALFCKDVLRLDRQAEEHMVMVGMSNELRPIAVFRISSGTSSITVTNPKGAFQRALLCGAASIMLVHNHPGGSLKPSEEDFVSCRRFIELGKLMELRLEDFLIVSTRGYISFREEHSDILPF